MGIFIKGKDKVSKRLTKMANCDEALTNVIQSGCMKIQADATKNCPVDTGNLRASITSKVENVDGKICGEVGTNVKYASAVNYGTRKMHARPFLTSAYENNIDEIKQEIQGVLGGGD